MLNKLSPIDLSSTVASSKIEETITDPAAIFLADDISQSATSYKRQRLNSGTILDQIDESETMTAQSFNGEDSMEIDSCQTKKQQSKGFLCLAFAIGMMACNSGLVGDVQQNSSLATYDNENGMAIQKLIDSPMSKHDNQMERLSSDFDIESKLINMNLASREQSIDNLPSSEQRPLNNTAKIMKSLQKGFNGPLSGLVKGLISGKQLHMTELMCQKANFFFWMSPNHCTMRLLRPQGTNVTI